MSESRKLTPALPSTVSELMLHRKTLAARNLNDDVEQIHLALWERDNYQKYFVAIWREDSLEGSFLLDETMAALQVRDHAKDNERSFPLARSAKLGAIIRSLHVVLKRYGQSRKERQHMVSGENVTFADDENL